MAKRLIPPGGPHRVRQVGKEQFEMSISIPKDADGRCARECPDPQCSPGYFKVKLGTGITEGQTEAFCPYCRHAAIPSGFSTSEQRRYAKDIAMREVHKGLQGMFKDALGIGSSNRRKLGGGMFSIEMSYKPGPLPHVSRPFEDEVRRDVVCPHCTLDQTVFGLATWCADCGDDVFMAHVAAELQVVRLMVGDVDRREESLGGRIAAKDLENCLEDIVSIFEAAMKALVRRALATGAATRDDIEVKLKRIGNAFQSIPRTRETLRELFDLNLGGDASWIRLTDPFEKRHPVTHNLGVIDRKYLERVQANERVGREIRISVAELHQLLKDVHTAIGSVHDRIIAT